MKTLLFILSMILFVSCDEAVSSYDREEMTALIIAKQVTTFKDSVVIKYGYDIYKLPIVAKGGRIYYPSISKSAGIRYYIVVK